MSTPNNQVAGMQGRARITDMNSEYNSLTFVIKQILGRANIATMCTVVGVTGGGVAKAPYVDLQPIINQVDGYGNTIPSGILYNVPTFRTQNGANAIISDPQIGDIGVALFSDKDISSLKSNYNNGTMAAVIANGVNPATRRRFDLADGMYFGGFYNGVPTNYLQLLNGILNVYESDTINLTAPTINLSSWAGMIAPFGMGSVPNGWLACPTAQTLVNVSSYPRLIVLGTTWGGNGTTTVGLPFFPAGYVPYAGTAGVLSHGLVKNHTHTVYAVAGTGFFPANASGAMAQVPATQTTSNPVTPEGGVDNLAAGYGVQYCVKY